MSGAIRNIGILAHVDAGKTTLSEHMLSLAGAIRAPGTVDTGTAHTDRLAVERRRGISVESVCAPFLWKGVRVNLIDTPGHTDFSSEIERALWALDGAVLLVAADEGVRPQTAALFEALRARGLPTLIALNKCDRAGADIQGSLHDIRTRLTPHAALADGDENIMAMIAEGNPEAEDAYLNGECYPHETLMERLAARVCACESYPVFPCAALRGQGVLELLDAVITLLPPPGGSDADALCGVVFAIREDDGMGRCAVARLFSGTARNRDEIETDGAPNAISARPRVKQKLTQIRDVALQGRGDDLGLARAGEVCALYGLPDARVGDVIGSREQLPRDVTPGGFRQPLLQVRAEAKGEDGAERLRRALSRLTESDPLLAASWSEGAREQRVQVMGVIQLETLAEQLKEQFGLEASFSAPTVIYRETIAHAATGFVAYTMPKPCWAVLRFELEPLPRGEGIRYESVVPVRDIMARYQHQVSQALPLALRQGLWGWQVDDVSITLSGGEHHLIHTHPLDFIVATPMGIHDGLRRAGTVLLEPMIRVVMRVPATCGGRVLSDIVRMRGETLASESEGDFMRIVARLPVAESYAYPVELARVTSGHGDMTIAMAGYRDCPPGTRAERPREGVSPLDRAKYILAARSALEGGIFD